VWASSGDPWTVKSGGAAVQSSMQDVVKIAIRFNYSFENV